MNYKAIVYFTLLLFIVYQTRHHAEDSSQPITVETTSDMRQSIPLQEHATGTASDSKAADASMATSPGEQQWLAQSQSYKTLYAEFDLYESNLQAKTKSDISGLLYCKAGVCRRVDLWRVKKPEEIVSAHRLFKRDGMLMVWLFTMIRTEAGVYWFYAPEADPTQNVLFVFRRKENPAELPASCQVVKQFLEQLPFMHYSLFQFVWQVDWADLQTRFDAAVQSERPLQIAVTPKDPTWTAYQSLLLEVDQTTSFPKQIHIRKPPDNTSIIEFTTIKCDLKVENREIFEQLVPDQNWLIKKIRWPFDQLVENLPPQPIPNATKP